MKLNNKGGATTAIIVILTILLVASLGYIGYDKLIAKDESKDNQTTVEDQNKTPTPEVIDYKKVGCDAFEKYLEEYKTSTKEDKIVSYKINSCNPTSNESMGYNNTSEKFYLQVSYDVEVSDTTTSLWLWGSGTPEGNTIKNKTNFVSVIKSDSEYKVETLFTGW